MKIDLLIMIVRSINRFCLLGLLLLPFIATTSALLGLCQEHPINEEEDLIFFNQPDKLNDDIYYSMMNYRIIMVGEMHGTREPAQFVQGLIQLMLNNGDSVVLGLEIPSEKLNLKENHPLDSAIFSSTFFDQSPVDGRENCSWAELIYEFWGTEQVKLFFFDANKRDYEGSRKRDSIMYSKVKKEYIKHPGRRIITLGGNIHNRLELIGKNKTMGYYLKNDSLINSKDSIFSIYHFYEFGEMRNNTGQGIELRKMNISSKYSTCTERDNYLYIDHKGSLKNFNAVLFTRRVTAADLVKETKCVITDRKKVKGKID